MKRLIAVIVGTLLLSSCQLQGMARQTAARLSPSKVLLSQMRAAKAQQAGSPARWTISRFKTPQASVVKSMPARATFRPKAVSQPANITMSSTPARVSHVEDMIAKKSDVNLVDKMRNQVKPSSYFDRVKTGAQDLFNVQLPTIQSAGPGVRIPAIHLSPKELGIAGISATGAGLAGTYLGRRPALEVPTERDQRIRRLMGYPSLAFEEYFKRGLSPNETTSKGDTLLHLAVEEAEMPIQGLPTKVDMILAYGGAVNRKNDRGETPLHLANTYADVNALLSAHANVLAKDQRGMTPVQRVEERLAVLEKSGESRAYEIDQMRAALNLLKFAEEQEKSLKPLMTQPVQVQTPASGMPLDITVGSQQVEQGDEQLKEPGYSWYNPRRYIG